VCSDNIFIQNEFILSLINNISLHYDYVSYRINDLNAILTHWGLFGEYVTLDALKKVQTKANTKEYFEHVTNYIYTHPEEFKIKYLDVPLEIKRRDIRLTIDTIEDFRICKNIIEILEENNLKWNYKNILSIINNNKEILDQMKISINNNKKT